ncbi:energy-coupling factor ABC transporter permease [Clostridium sp. UBA4548]|uniref:energy-coupling factor ABC transporter permease n=1 Tax=Clostridium sp. UBA4548 TaxID=1946361 RepID=UPI0025BCC655|nr:energy-coupling factor ABC transporter permease [Clostridium sp. UBA4548]
MHMADALISPIVGGTMWVATAGVATYSIKKLKVDLEEEKIPLMGVMGAFIFAAQMINFTIPGTGSSGHLGGGMLLAAILGPYAGFIAMACILTIQALFFADGGLIALGCNIFNLGFYTCFIAYPLIYKKVLSKGYSKKKIIYAAILSSIIGLQLGALSVVLQTFFSGKTELPFVTFVALMQPIHLAIGVVEGIISATVISFVWTARPNTIEKVSNETSTIISLKKVVIPLLVASVFIGGVLSLVASSNPDGLEWAMFKTSGKEEMEAKYSTHEKAKELQENTGILPDYGFKKESEDSKSEDKGTVLGDNIGTSISGVIGGMITLVLAGAIGIGINIVKKKNNREQQV